MNLYQFPEGQILAFALVLLRVLAFFIAWPVFGTQLVPNSVKILLAIIFSLTVFPALHFSNPELLTMGDNLILLVVRESAIGLVLGFSLRAFFYAISVAGEITSVTMGINSAQLFNPASGENSNVFEQFQLVLATLFFLTINGHHLFIQGLAHSFELIPVSSVGFNYKAFAGFSTIAQKTMLMGLKMSAPVLVAVLMANLSMGIVGRAVPQINVLVTSFPVTIMVGIAVMFVCIPFVLHEMTGLLDIMTTEFLNIMRTM